MTESSLRPSVHSSYSVSMGCVVTGYAPVGPERVP